MPPYALFIMLSNYEISQFLHQILELKLLLQPFKKKFEATVDPDKKKMLEKQIVQATSWNSMVEQYRTGTNANVKMVIHNIIDACKDPLAEWLDTKVR